MILVSLFWCVAVLRKKIYKYESTCLEEAVGAQRMLATEFNANTHKYALFAKNLQITSPVPPSSVKKSPSRSYESDERCLGMSIGMFAAYSIVGILLFRSKRRPVMFHLSLLIFILLASLLSLIVMFHLSPCATLRQGDRQHQRVYLPVSEAVWQGRHVARSSRVP